MFSEIGNTNSNLKMHPISFHIPGTYSEQGSMTQNHNLSNSSHSGVCEYALLNLMPAVINVIGSQIQYVTIGVA